MPVTVPATPANRPAPLPASSVTNVPSPSVKLPFSTPPGNATKMLPDDAPTPRRTTSPFNVPALKMVELKEALRPSIE